MSNQTHNLPPEPHLTISSPDANSPSSVAHLATADSNKIFFRRAETLLSSERLIDHLVVAEICEKWGSWHAGAQIYLDLILNDSGTGPEATFCSAADANRSIKLIRGSDPQISSRGDFTLYLYSRLVRYLSKLGITDDERMTWIRQSVYTSLKKQGISTEETSQLFTTLESLVDASNVSPHYQAFKSEFLRDVVAGIICARPPKAKLKSRFLIYVIGILAIAATVAGAWLLAPFIQPTKSSSLFYTDSRYLVAALIAWPLLLLVTWVFALAISLNTGTFSYIAPRSLSVRRRIYWGELMPFRTDWFYHLFQFFWIPYMVVCLMAIYKTDPLDQLARNVLTNSEGAALFLENWHASAVVSDLNFASPWEFIRSFLVNDAAVILVAGIIGLIFAALQIRIQVSRLTRGIDVYWWDIRIDQVEWTVRLAMVILDAFLGFILFCKMLAIALYAVDLVWFNSATISYFHPDGAGGLHVLGRMYVNVLWMVFLFGILVMASLYLHRNLEEYRTTDSILLVVYFVVVSVGFAPLFLMEAQLVAAQYTAYQLLDGTVRELSAEGKSLVSTAEAVEALSRRSVTLFDMSLITGAAVPLLSQAVLIAVQAVYQSRDQTYEASASNTNKRLN